MGTRLLLHYSNQQISAVCTLAWTFSHRLRTPQSPDRFYPRLRTLINLPIDPPCSRFVPSQIQFLKQSNFASPLSPALPLFVQTLLRAFCYFICIAFFPAADVACRRLLHFAFVFIVAWRTKTNYVTFVTIIFKRCVKVIFELLFLYQRTR